MKFEYNPDMDILTVESRDYSNYSSSAELANFVVDMDKKGEILGVEIIDVSQVIPLEKEELRNISDINFKAERTEEFLEISLEIFIDGSKNIISSNFPVDTGLEA